MAWSNYIEQQTQNNITPDNPTSEMFLICTSLALVVVITLISYLFIKRWKNHNIKHKEEFRRLTDRKSWRLTQVVYWTVGFIYILSVLLKDLSGSDYLLGFTARLSIVSVFYFLMRELYCYVQFGKSERQRLKSNKRE